MESGAYADFLARTSIAMAPSGAVSLLPRGDVSGRVTWTEGWDLLLLNDTPGSQTFYAFTRATDPAEVRRRFDVLANGLASAGVLQGRGTGVVVVVVSESALDEQAGRRLTGVTPSSFFDSLRPTSWAVDLHARRVYAPRLGQPPGLDMLNEALQGSGDLSEGALLAGEAARLAEERNRAFYALMRGRQPLATYGLIALNVAIFLVLERSGGADDSTTLLNFGALSPHLIEHGQWWRLFTAMFLHASVPHILFNMMSLGAIGTLAERLYGSFRFVLIYLGAGLIGSIVSLLWSVVQSQPDIVGVGASGAIFGVAGALVTVRLQSSEVIPKALRNRISTSVLPLVILSLVIAFATPHVDNSAHLGGLVGGAALSFLLPLTRTYPAQSEA